ncbi:MAG TPA: AMP-binding protein [Terriglobia bacterium]|nr:AMP-binding protein [Terriglobia bacterium]
MSFLQPTNLWSVFESTVQAGPERPALVFSDATVSFAKLAELAARAAAGLVALGLRSGDIVALEMPKRLETYALWLACIRQAFTYVFIDPKNPPERTVSILARTQPALHVSLADSSLADDVNPHGRHLALGGDTAGADWIEKLAGDAAPVDPAAAHGLTPAYIMFTSGSTGEPKGAVIPHQGVISLMTWARDKVIRGEQLRFSNLNPLHFDNSVFDLYCGLMNGAALVPVETAALSNPMAWVRRLRDGLASAVFAVPTLFLTLDRLKLLTPDSLPQVRVFLFGGEGFPIEALKAFHQRFAGQARLINVYGPTETSCICSSIEIDAAQLAAAKAGFASLGRMHPGFDYLVLDAEQQPATVGELWIGGPCVGLGYYANAEETQRRFCQDPRQDRYRSVWYRSGDLVSEDAAGLLWFRGRADNQVKIRGHRIELEEIDLAVEQIADVLRASCVAVEGMDGLELRLAFAAKRAIPVADVLAHCTSNLPTYMRPSRVVQLDQLPENANGKVDRKAVRVLLAALQE